MLLLAICARCYAQSRMRSAMLLVRAKTTCLQSTETGEGIRLVSSFFSELENTVDVLDDKYGKRLRFSDVQRLLPSRGMISEKAA